MMIRTELPHDHTAVRAIAAQAFGRPAEADLIEALREQACPIISLVAEVDGDVAGHSMFSPVSLNGHPSLKIIGLAPMAVAPEFQRRGIGTALVREGLEQSRRLGFGAVVVLGHPGYYLRFGFVPARRFGITCEYAVPEEVFMAMELVPDFLSKVTGTISYHPAFTHLRGADMETEYTSFDEVVRFHGHTCAGLAIGYRMTCAALDALKARHAKDEELVAIVENNACGVDAVQFVAGCTFGKGNLVFRDWGKHVYTLCARKTGRGVRVSFHGKGIPDGLREDREAFTAWVLTAPIEDFIDVRDVVIDEPDPARIHKSETCALCGETVMETRLREVDGRKVCIPCGVQKKYR